jgi:hypothetical protein
MSNADWWAKKLGNTPQTPVGRPDIAPPMPASQQPMAQMPAFQPPTQAPTKAQSASQVATCPDCGSGNYFAIANAAPRCYDCGYPLQQSGSAYGSLTGARVEGTAKGALGNNAANNWNPTTIIGEVK